MLRNVFGQSVDIPETTLQNNPEISSLNIENCKRFSVPFVPFFGLGKYYTHPYFTNIPKCTKLA
jgi:hypothetical protein